MARAAKIKRVLVPVNDSDAAMKAVTYAADLVKDDPASEVFLFHVLPPFPPELLEHQGGDTAEEEDRLEARMKREQEDWLKQKRHEVNSIFEQARNILTRSGVHERVIHLICEPSAHASEIARDIVDIAHDMRCDEVVLGHEAYPWYKEMFEEHVDQQVSKLARHIDVAVHVV